MDNVLLVALAIAVIGLGLIAAALAGRDRRDHRTARQLASVERKLDALLGHLGLDLADVSYPEVERLLAEGKKVHAIKAYREATGAGLVDAKNDVDRIERQRAESTAPTVEPTDTAASGPAATEPSPAEPATTKPATAEPVSESSVAKPGQ